MSAVFQFSARSVLLGLSLSRYRLLLTTSQQCNIGILQQKKYSHKRNFSKDSPRLSTWDISSEKCAEVSLDLLQEGRLVEVSWPDNSVSRFHSVWLRHNCHCSLCKQKYSGQILIDSSSIDPQSVLDNINVLDSCVELSWRGKEIHKGVIPLSWLKDNCYSESSRIKESQERNISPFVGNIPQVSFKDISNSEDSLFSFLSSTNDLGIVIVTDVPSESKSVSKIAELIAPIQNTIYSMIFDVVSKPQPINVAYSTAKIPFHMDLVYYESPPGLQLLHCLRFDPEVEGGENMFIDSFQAAKLFQEEFPHHFDSLVRIPASFQKIHYDRDWPVHMKYKRPHITLNPQGQVIGVFWAPPFEAPLQVAEEDVQPYYDAYHKFSQFLHECNLQVEYKLKVGECVLFNNRRILHARKEFILNGGTRYFQGCYINIDEFKSKVEFMMVQRKTGKHAKRVGNQCFL
ncbi:putative gamma-butyrobetaine dioxygenase [Saccoglossus kowalevskii]